MTHRTNDARCPGCGSTVCPYPGLECDWDDTAQSPTEILDETLAKVWDEGYEAAVRDVETRSAPPGPNGPVDPTTNPYRRSATSSDSEYETVCPSCGGKDSRHEDRCPVLRYDDVKAEILNSGVAAFRAEDGTTVRIDFRDPKEPE